MADLALIIAIESYPDAQEGFTAKQLEHTLKAGLRFRGWLKRKWKKEGRKGQILFCSEPKLRGGCGATLNDIIDAVDELVKRGRNQTENLYVYFSGHGFRLAGDKTKLADVLVASNFKNTRQSASSCFKLDALVEGLRVSLGLGYHYYFIDACRNEVERSLGSELMPFDGKGDEEASIFVLQSTVPGMPALVGGPFAQSLLDGLRGAGTAKDWDPPIRDSMKVRFDTLSRFLSKRLKDTQPVTQATNGQFGVRDAILSTIKPVPSMTLSLVVRNRKPWKKGVARVATFNGAPVEHALTGETTQLKLSPDSYGVSVSLDNDTFVSKDAVDVELFEDAEVVFDQTRLVRPTLGGELGRGLEILESFSLEAPPPPPPPEPAWRRHLALDSMVRLLGARPGYLVSSGRLGDALEGDPDLSLWLAVIGAAMITDDPENDRLIQQFPLARFDGAKAGLSPVFVLAAFDRVDVNLKVAIRHGDAVSAPQRVDVFDLTSVGLRGVHQAVAAPPAGQFFVTVTVDDQPPYTVASVAMPNRCTLITITMDDDEQLEVAQYLPPIGHLITELAPFVQDRVRGRHQVEDVYQLARLIRAFRQRRRLETEFNRGMLEELLYAKWVDPIGASLAAYECARRNEVRYLPEVSRNLNEFFPALPDARAIARLSGEQRERRGVPLFLDGLRVLAGDEPLAERLQWLPFPKEQLDYTGPWTAWRGLVDRA